MHTIFIAWSQYNNIFNMYKHVPLSLRSEDDIKERNATRTLYVKTLLFLTDLDPVSWRDFLCIGIDSIEGRNGLISWIQHRARWPLNQHIKVAQCCNRLCTELCITCIFCSISKFKMISIPLVDSECYNNAIYSLHLQQMMHWSYCKRYETFFPMWILGITF